MKIIEKEEKRHHELFTLVIEEAIKRDKIYKKTEEELKRTKEFLDETLDLYYQTLIEAEKWEEKYKETKKVMETIKAQLKMCAEFIKITAPIVETFFEDEEYLHAFFDQEEATDNQIKTDTMKQQIEKIMGVGSPEHLGLLTHLEQKEKDDSSQTGNQPAVTRTNVKSETGEVLHDPEELMWGWE